MCGLQFGQFFCFALCEAGLKTPTRAEAPIAGTVSADNSASAFRVHECLARKSGGCGTRSSPLKAFSWRLLPVFLRPLALSAIDEALGYSPAREPKTSHSSSLKGL